MARKPLSPISCGLKPNGKMGYLVGNRWISKQEYDMLAQYGRPVVPNPKVVPVPVVRKVAPVVQRVVPIVPIVPVPVVQRIVAPRIYVGAELARILITCRRGAPDQP